MNSKITKVLFRAFVAKFVSVAQSLRLKTIGPFVTYFCEIADAFLL